MSKMEKEAIGTMQELLDAMVIARDELRKSEQRTRRLLNQVDRGHSLASAAVASEPADLRRSFDDAMDGVTTLRHRARSLIFALAVEEGCSIGEVGRTWGISRQLASRYVREGANGTG
jgi:hypothetical protein